MNQFFSHLYFLPMNLNSIAFISKSSKVLCPSSHKLVIGKKSQEMLWACGVMIKTERERRDVSSVRRMLTDCTGQKASAAICLIITVYLENVFYRLSAFLSVTRKVLALIRSMLAVMQDKVKLWYRKCGKINNTATVTDAHCCTLPQVGASWFLDAVDRGDTELFLDWIFSTFSIDASSFWLPIWGTAPANHVIKSAGELFEVIKLWDHLSIFDVGVIPWRAASTVSIPYGLVVIGLQR